MSLFQNEDAVLVVALIFTVIVTIGAVAVLGANAIFWAASVAAALMIDCLLFVAANRLMITCFTATNRLLGVRMVDAPPQQHVEQHCNHGERTDRAEHECLRLENGLEHNHITATLTRHPLAEVGAQLLQ